MILTVVLLVLAACMILYRDVQQFRTSYEGMMDQWNVCMFVCMCVYVCMYVCMYVRMYLYMYACMYVHMYVCMYVSN